MITVESAKDTVLCLSAKSHILMPTQCRADKRWIRLLCRSDSVKRSALLGTQGRRKEAGYYGTKYGNPDFGDRISQFDSHSTITHPGFHASG